MEYKSNTLYVIIVGIAVIVGITLLDFYLRPRVPNMTLLTLGIVAASIGAIIRIVAQVNLGKNFSFEAKIKKDHALIKTGIHSVVRHPMYTGMFLMVLGLCIAMQSIIGIVMNALILIPIGLYRVNVEERLLLRRFGDEYKKYVFVTKKFVPYVW
jgi:protein-S-isoprenylcysteine O-methyltransferase Ste14